MEEVGLAPGVGRLASRTWACTARVGGSEARVGALAGVVRSERIAVASAAPRCRGRVEEVDDDPPLVLAPLSSDVSRHGRCRHRAGGEAARLQGARGPRRTSSPTASSAMSAENMRRLRPGTISICTSSCVSYPVYDRSGSSQARRPMEIVAELVRVTE